MAKFEESTDDTERLTFYPDGTALIIRYSMLGRKFHKCKMQLTEKQYNLWKNSKVLIQEAMPHLDNEEREFLMSGYTPEDWVRMFPPDEEDEEPDV